MKQRPLGKPGAVVSVLGIGDLADRSVSLEQGSQPGSVIGEVLEGTV